MCCNEKCQIVIFFCLHHTMETKSVWLWFFHLPNNFKFNMSMFEFLAIDSSIMIGITYNLFFNIWFVMFIPTSYISSLWKVVFLQFHFFFVGWFLCKKCCSFGSCNYQNHFDATINGNKFWGENLLRCTTQDEKGLVFNAILFYLIFWSS
jgi:hypothetical protein